MSFVDEQKDIYGHRNCTCSLVFDILDTNKTFNGYLETKKNIIVMEIERGILNRSIELCKNNNFINSWSINQFVDLYKSTRLIVCTILEDINTSSVIEDIIIKRTINLCDLSTIKSYQLRPDLYEKIYNYIAETEQVNVIATYHEDGWVCSKCRGTKYKIRNVQTRSSDEPVSEFRICIGCMNSTSM